MITYSATMIRANTSNVLFLFLGMVFSDTSLQQFQDIIHYFFLLFGELPVLIYKPFQQIRTPLRRQPQGLFELPQMDVLVVAADLLGRIAFAPSEVPVGVFTALLGVPFFLYLVKEGRSNA